LSLKKELFEYYLQQFKPKETDERSRSRSRRRVIEGIFDGECLRIGDRRFPVPENYASKSKLVTGDRLKLTIEKDGSYVFKVIEPVERKKMVGKLQEVGGEYQVRVKKRLYKVLKASVTYLKARPGDYISIATPKKGESCFAAVENVIK
jgi:hypothetical protein